MSYWIFYTFTRIEGPGQEIESVRGRGGRLQRQRRGRSEEECPAPIVQHCSAIEERHLRVVGISRSVITFPSWSAPIANYGMSRSHTFHLSPWKLSSIFLFFYPATLSSSFNSPFFARYFAAPCAVTNRSILQKNVRARLSRESRNFARWAQDAANCERLFSFRIYIDYLSRAWHV